MRPRTFQNEVLVIAKSKVESVGQEEIHLFRVFSGGMLSATDKVRR
jgi:hypothetical protein